jgi:hypothetical protein
MQAHPPDEVKAASGNGRQHCDRDAYLEATNKQGGVMCDQGDGIGGAPQGCA